MATAIFFAGFLIAGALNPNLEVKAKLFVPTVLFALGFDIVVLWSLLTK
jgi:hypothetical protein